MIATAKRRAKSTTASSRKKTETQQIRAALTRIEEKLDQLARELSRASGGNQPSATELSSTSASASFEPTRPVPWVWQRLADALGMDLSAMSPGRPLREVNRTALTSRLNDRFADKGIRFSVGNLRAARTVGDVYDVIMAKLNK